MGKITNFIWFERIRKNGAKKNTPWIRSAHFSLIFWLLQSIFSHRQISDVRCASDQIETKTKKCHMQLYCVRFWMNVSIFGRSLNWIHFKFKWTNATRLFMCAAHHRLEVRLACCMSSAWLIVLAMLQNANIIQRITAKIISYLVRAACINCTNYYVKMYFVVCSFVRLSPAILKSTKKEIVEPVTVFHFAKKTKLMIWNSVCVLRC